MIPRWRMTLGLMLTLSAIFTFFRVPTASSQGLTVVVAEVDGELPEADPESELWDGATAVEVPLSAQNAARPMLLETNVRSVTVRALHNQVRIAIEVEWVDSTRDESVVRVEEFRDAVAIQFPLVDGPPFFCMGQAGGNVNIWHWKADWQADIARGARSDVEGTYPGMHVDSYPFADPTAGLAAGPATYLDSNYLPAFASGNLLARASYASPVEDLIAGGFGSLTSQSEDGQNVQGFGVWNGGGWRVIFSRDLSSPESEDIILVPGRLYSVAFAAWDGSNGERNGQKSTSQWISLGLEGAPPAAGPSGAAAATGAMEGFWFVVAPMLATAGLLAAGVAMALLVASLAAIARSKK